MPVQKQTRAGQRTRFKAFVAIGDYNGHVGLGVKCSKEVATAIRGAIILAKLSIVPVRRGFWGNKIGRPHTVPCKVTGKCGSIWVRLIPAPRGTGIVSAPVPKKLLQMAGIEDCYTSARGSTGTLGNFGNFLVRLLSFNTVVVDTRGPVRWRPSGCSRTGNRSVVFGAVIFLTVYSAWPQCRRVNDVQFWPSRALWTNV